MSEKLTPAEKLRYKLEDELKNSLRDVEDAQIEMLLHEVPRKWEKHGDLILLPNTSFRHNLWTVLGSKLFVTICEVLNVKRIARKNRIKSDVFRSSNVELLWGDSAIVSHKDNKILYQWDITKCMFSIGNITEKLRIAQFNCQDEIVVDLFAGIGYFVLPYLVHAKARHVHACEINPQAVEALRWNLKANKVEERCTVHLGDNRVTCPTGVADRVNLGLIPSSEMSWETACKALKSDKGGMLHIHANVDSKLGTQSNGTDIFKFPEWESWTLCTISTISGLLHKVKGSPWKVEFVHLEHVKSYAPHVDHLVLDLCCRPNIIC